VTRLSPRSQQKFAELCSDHGTVRAIADLYEAHGFDLPANFEPEQGRQRRSICAAAEAGADLNDPTACDRRLRVYVDGIEDFGRRPLGGFFPAGEEEGTLWPPAEVLIRALQRDGAPVDDEGNLTLGGTPPALPIDRFDRLGEPRVLLQHVQRIETGIAADPAAAIGSAKELVESSLKFVLDDYGVAYDRSAGLTDLYKLVAKLGLSREAVPESRTGSQAAHKVLQNLATAVQSLAELRNALGLGHGQTRRSPALARHARLAANAARTVVGFVLETWHERKAAGA
jgi:hypothetical protein